MRQAQASRSVVPFPAAASPDVTRREGQGPQGSARRPRPLFGTALPTCVLCVPNSRLMAQNPPPRLGSPARTASPRHRHLCRRAAVWTTWTSWGRPSCSSPCPRSPNKCGGEGTAWLGWGGSVPRPQQHLLPGSPRPRGQRPGAHVLPRAAVANGPPRAKHCTGLEGGSGARGRCRAPPAEHRAASHRAGAGDRSCLFQGEETKARETGRPPSRPPGTAGKPGLSCAPDLSAPEDSPPQCHVPQQGRSSSQPPGSHSGTYRIKATAAQPAPVPPASSTRHPPSPLGLRSSPR